MLAGDTSWTRDPFWDWWNRWWDDTFGPGGGGGWGGGGGGGGGYDDPGGNGGGGGGGGGDVPVFRVDVPGTRYQIPTDKPQWLGPEDPNAPIERDQVYVPDDGVPVFRADVTERLPIPRQQDILGPSPQLPPPPTFIGNPGRDNPLPPPPYWTLPDPVPDPGTPTIPRTGGSTTNTTYNYSISQPPLWSFEGRRDLIGAPLAAEKLDVGPQPGKLSNMGAAVAGLTPGLIGEGATPTTGINAPVQDYLPTKKKALSSGPGGMPSYGGGIQDYLRMIAGL